MADITVKVKVSEEVIKNLIAAYRTERQIQGKKVKDPSEKWIRGFLTTYLETGDIADADESDFEDLVAEYEN